MGIVHAAEERMEDAHMWSDNETSEDFLNFGCVAATAAELISQADGAPLSMGVSGSWGVGKSSMLNLITHALMARQEEDDTRYIFVRFNAWLYQGYDDARAALLEQIATTLVTEAKGNETALEKAKGFLGRVNWFRVAGLAAGSAVAVAAGLPPVGLIGALVRAVKGATDGDLTSDDAEAVDKSGQDLIAEAAKTVGPSPEASPPQQIHLLRQSFEETLKAMEATLVVFIDDLDRCLPSTAISTLEAVRLFLFLPHTAFVVAADDKMIRQAVRTHFGVADLNDDLVTNYFDKLIQIPLRVPPLGTQEVRAYLMLLYLQKSSLEKETKEEARRMVCERLSSSWSGDYVDLEYMRELLPDADDALLNNLQRAERLAPLLTTADKIQGNPRLIKRFLNTLAIRMAVARLQGVAVDESALAKVLLFERCAGEAAYRRLVTAVIDGKDGRPEFLREWEADVRSGKPLGNVDADFETDFFKSWLALDPALGESDLRTAIYVSREAMPIVTAADEMSVPAQQLLQALAQLKTNTSTLRDEIQELSGRDQALMLERLLFRARQEQSWSSASVLYPYLAFIEAVPNAGKSFGDVLKQANARNLGPGIIPLLADMPWAAKALEKWARSADSPGTVKQAIKRAKERKDN